MTTPLIIPFESVERLSHALQQLKPVYHSNNQITVVLPSAHYMSNEFTLDTRLSDAEIILFLQSNAKRVFGHAAEQLSFDYKKEKIKDLAKQKITAFASHLPTINNIQNCFQKEKIGVHAIGIEDEQAINLLPWREVRRKKNIRARNRRLILYGLISLSVLFVVKFFLIKKTKELNTETHLIQYKNKALLAPDAAQHAALLKKLQLVNAEKTLAVKNNTGVLSVLSAIANNLPNNVVLDSLTLKKQKIKLSGVSNQLAGIHQFNAKLQQNCPWKNSQLTEIHNDAQKPEMMHFVIHTVSPTDERSAA
ncbi:MAG: PilN domain-containing protein [Gammaproteobacteria bacterium]|nr:PilN domain-containing protein [Gammaproteobacteria bacterium]